MDAAQKTEHSFEMQEVISTLGLRWRPNDDMFCFKVSMPKPSSIVTKRTILSEIARLFDPLGWLAPVTIKAKILLQNLWMQGAEWDSPAPKVLQQQWLYLREQLSTIENLIIPRWFHTTSSTSWMLHGFLDASERAYSATMYLVTGEGAQTKSTLMIAKSRVSPIKVVSLSKLELCGAQLLAQLISSILPQLSPQPTAIHCWTDSQVVLAWLSGHRRQSG